MTIFLLEQAYIWSAWGECDKVTCLQRRTRKCRDDETCAGSGDHQHLSEDHVDLVPEGYEKFDRRCSDHSDCFAQAIDQLPSSGKYCGSLKIHDVIIFKISNSVILAIED